MARSILSLAAVLVASACAEVEECQSGEGEETSLLQFQASGRSLMTRPLPQCKDLSETEASQCPTVSPVNPSLKCIYNPACVTGGGLGCVEHTGCQYVSPPSLSQLKAGGALPECEKLSQNETAPSQCPSVGPVNPSLKCIYNPACVTGGGLGCVEHTGCQYVSPPSLSQLEAARSTCPDFAASTTPGFGGDCVCPDGEWCSTNGADSNCHNSVGPGPWPPGGLNGAYFRPDCDECRCFSDIKKTCPDFAASTTPGDGGDCMCPHGNVCSTNGHNINCPNSEGFGPWPPGAFGGEFFRPDCDDCRCYSDM